MKDYFLKLQELQKNAYCKYSNFNVACIIVMNDGTEIKGVNVENAAFPAGICAERVAMSQLITQGLNYKDISSLHLYTVSEDYVMPCGFCRQFLAEFLGIKIPIYVYNKFEFKLKTNMQELLPFSFREIK